MMKRALITGQNGSYLVKPILSRGYKVHGVIRQASTFKTVQIDHLYVDRHEPGAQVPSPASSATRARFCGETPSRTARPRLLDVSKLTRGGLDRADIPPDSVNAVAVVGLA